MASITSWSRLEPRPRSGAMRASLEAQVRDPLWLLGRQWQLGEFQGEDAGTPVSARLRAERSAVTRWAPGRPGPGGSGRALDSEVVPLERAVEVELSAGTGLLRSAEAGLAFLRLLGDRQLASKYTDDYLESYKIERPSATELQRLDSETIRLRELFAGRAPDGVALYADLIKSLSGGGLPKEPSIDAGDVALVTEAAKAWVDWFGDLFEAVGSAATAWRPDRLEYEFAIGARTGSGQVALTSREYEGGHLDWYAFDRHPTATLGAGSDPSPEPIVRTTLPTPVRFSGMPSPRYWEWEDERTSFAEIEAAADDLGRMLLIEFGLVYGNDFFYVPVELAVGSLCLIQSLVVTDNFGERTLIKPASQADGATARWRMFTLSDDHLEATPAGRRDEMFLLPPVLGPSLQGEELEDVLLLRDEMANMAWAVERKVEGQSGLPLDRHQALQEQNQRREQEQEAQDPGSTSPSTGELEYQLASDVPDQWFPLFPVKVGQRSIALRVGEVPARPASAKPLSRTLGEVGPGQLIPEEEVPRTGTRVTRAWQYARWIDGSTWIWIGRRRGPGGGEGSSGIRFDQIKHGADEES
jgi:hypothetical protein